jgi:hypothetical protein
LRSREFLKSACQTLKPRSTYFRNALLLRHMILTADIYQVSGKNKMYHPVLQPYAKKKIH